MNAIKLTLKSLVWALIQHQTSVHIREGACKEREMPYKDTETQVEDGRMKMEAETIDLHGQACEQAGLPRARRGKEAPSPKSFGWAGPADTLALNFWPSEF